MQGCTPLHIAAAQGQPETLQLLLRHGADIAVVDALVRSYMQCSYSSWQRWKPAAVPWHGVMVLVDHQSVLACVPSCHCV